MTVISCNVKHYCPTLCAWDVIIKSSKLAGLLGSWLGASIALVRVMRVTESQHPLLSVEVQRKKRSTVGRRHQLVVLVYNFMMLKAQRSFFLISKSQYAENRSHEVLAYCVILFHLHFSITHSRFA